MNQNTLLTMATTGIRKPHRRPAYYERGSRLDFEIVG